jgi:hypothetical protein
MMQAQSCIISVKHCKTSKAGTTLLKKTMGNFGRNRFQVKYENDFLILKLNLSS